MVPHLAGRDDRAVKGIRSLLGENQAVQQAQERRFSGTIGTAQEDGLARFDGFCKVAEDGPVVIGETDVVELNHENTPSRRMKR